MRSVKFVIGAAVIAAGCFFACLNTAQADGREERSTLAGLQGVHVVVEQIDPEQKIATIVTSNLQNEIEAKLAAAGIKVLGDKEMLQSPGMPYLYVNINTAKSGIVYAYHIQLELRQGVVLERDTSIVITASTWTGTGMTGMLAASEINKLRTFVEYGVTEFIKSFSQANLKQTSQNKERQ